MQISQHSIYFSFNRLLADGSLMPDMKIDFNSNYNIKYYQTFQLTKGWLADGGEGLKIINEKTRLLIVGGGRVNGESILPRPSSGETLGEL